MAKRPRKKDGTIVVVTVSTFIASGYGGRIKEVELKFAGVKGYSYSGAERTLKLSLDPEANQVGVVKESAIKPIDKLI